MIQNSELPRFKPFDAAQCVGLVGRIGAELIEMRGTLKAVAKRREQPETVDDDRDDQAVDTVKNEVPVLGGDMSKQ